MKETVSMVRSVQIGFSKFPEFWEKETNEEERHTDLEFSHISFAFRKVVYGYLS